MRMTLENREMRASLVSLVALQIPAPTPATPIPETYILASYPRSGSHWLRALIEAATGYATASQYPDLAGDCGPAAGCLDARDAEPWTSPRGGHPLFLPRGGLTGDARAPTAVLPLVVRTHYPKDYGGSTSVFAEAC